MEHTPGFVQLADALRCIIGVNGPLTERVTAKAAALMDAHPMPLALHHVGRSTLGHANPVMGHLLGAATGTEAAAVAVPAALITDRAAQWAIQEYLLHFEVRCHQPFALPLRWPLPKAGSGLCLWQARCVGRALKRPVVVSTFVDLVPDVANNPISTRYATLSARERQVAGLLGQCLTNEGVAQRLHISPDTLATHRRNIKRKLEADDLFALLPYCVGTAMRRDDTRDR